MITVLVLKKKVILLLVILQIFSYLLDFNVTKLVEIVTSSPEKMPRLHFLSDDDLLSALTNADSLNTAKHVTIACFPNILDITVEPRMDEKDRKLKCKITPVLCPVSI